MWRNYLLVAVRSLAKSRAYAAINIAGLAIGLAACVLILLYVRYERSYDDWMPGADRAFQVQTFYEATDTGGEEMKLQVSSIVSGRALQKDYPQQVEKLVWMRSFAPVVIQDGQAGQIENLRMADGNLFDIMPVPFVRGSAATALPDTNSIVLSESEAKRRFGDADPIGKTLTIVDNMGNVDYRVTGVFRDWPENSSFSAEAVARFDLGVQFADRLPTVTGWGNQQGWTYVRLRSPADAELINANMPAWEKRNIPDEVTEGQRTNQGDLQDYRLTNLRDIHLGEAQRASVTPGNDRLTVATFAVIALLILGGIVWTALDMRRLAREPLSAPARMTGIAALALGLLAVQIAWGAFTAGLDAGYAFSSWPLMGDAWFPDGVPTPVAADTVNNPIVVQFIHRWFAFAAAAALVWLSVCAAKAGSSVAYWVTGLVVLQILLGIATLMTGVHLHVAVSHQVNAALLLIATVWAAHVIGRVPVGRQRV